MSLFAMLFIGLLFWLLVGHAIVDFVFQTDTMAREKNWKSDTPLQAAVPWYYWMSAHCMIQAGMVTMITGSLFLGLAELVLHFIADCLKLAGIGNIHTDQFFHVVCKILWAFLAAQGGLVDVSDYSGTTGGK
jgi:hypothetical protein